jgi:APA family basic amino acid/polyamine antiporter
MAIIILGVFALSKNANWENLATVPNSPQLGGLKGFGAAMLAALWAYSGWFSLPMVAGEVQDPGRNIPRALIIGMLIVIVVYLLINLAYFYALPFSEIVTSNSTMYPNAVSVAGKAAQSFLGPLGLSFIFILILTSTIGTLHSEFLTPPRITFAMARDRLFFHRFGLLNKKTHVPVLAISVQAVLACLFAASGTFDQLTTFVVFMYWIFYGLAGASVFVLRKKMPDANRPYRTLGYPVIPLIFLLASIWLTINTLQSNPVESALGILLLIVGLPFYYYLRQEVPKE